jgi:phospholipid/cholesterol/gamma-HCH transport system substrate-binding protein
MEANRKRSIQMGIFLVLGLAFLMVTIIVLGGDKLLFIKKATLKAKFDHVQGLGPGSVISFAGIQIGNVLDTEVSDEDGKVIVTMRVDARFLRKLNNFSTVEIRTQGALGDKFLFINPGLPENTEASKTVAPLKDGDYVSSMAGKDFMTTLSEKGSDTKKVFEIISEVHLLLKSLNEDNNLGNTLKNFSEASLSLKQSANDFREITKSFKNDNQQKIASSVQRMSNILEKIDRGEGTLGALINDRSLHDSLKASLGSDDRKQTIKQLFRSSIEKSEK